MNKKKIIFYVLLSSICIISIFFVDLSSLNYINSFNLQESKQYPLNTKFWNQNGNPLCTNISRQSSIYIIINENGEAFIIWKDQRNEVVEGDIYAQFINTSGNIQWTLDGACIINATGEQIPNGLIYSGFNCSIFVWEDNRTGNYDIYVQKINSTGSSLWNSNGTVICNAINNQKEPCLVKDDNGGAIITWIDERNNNSELYVQYINATGSTQWIDNGTPICNITNLIINSPQICSDGQNGSIIAWYDNRTGYDGVYIQRINSSGSTLWLDNGTLIYGLNNVSVSNVRICVDGLNGSIISWIDNRTGINKVYVQRINSTGGSEWDSNGTAVCELTSIDQNEVEMCTDYQKGVILVFRDHQTGMIDYNIYAQKINSTGARKWNNGTAVCTAIGNQYSPELTNDGEGGAIFTWIDLRSANYKIYAQRVTQNGLINWTENGVLICSQSSLLDSPIITFNNNTGSYISWIDNRNDPLGDIYIQRLLNDGTLLYLIPNQLILYTPEPLKSIFEETWFYALIIILSIDILIIYKVLKPKGKQRKKYERNS